MNTSPFFLRITKGTHKCITEDKISLKGIHKKELRDLCLSLYLKGFLLGFVLIVYNNMFYS